MADKPDDQKRADKERADASRREETRQREDPSERHLAHRAEQEGTDVREIEHVEYLEGGNPSDLREVHPEDAHPQPDDGMDSPLVDPGENVRTNDRERSTEHNP